jgi:hypothetical protein
MIGKSNFRWEKLEVEPPEGQWTSKANVEQ